MSAFSITVDRDVRKLRIVGAAHVGDVVSVAVAGFAEAVGHLRLRAEFNGAVVALAPMDGGVGEWSASGEDAACTLNLGTAELIAVGRANPHAAKIPLYFTLDSIVDGTVYGRSRHDVFNADVADEGVPVIPEDEAEALRQELGRHLQDSVRHVTVAERSTWNAKYAKPSGGIPAADLASAVRVSLGRADTALQATDVSGKADKSEMSVTAGIGADADKATIQLKSGTSAVVLTAHQDISGKADKNDTYTKAQVDEKIADIDVSGCVQADDLAAVATSGSYNDLDDKPDIPSRVSDLENDKGFLTASALSGRLTRSIVQALPQSGQDTSVIYMVPKSTPKTGDVYDEYMWIGGAWERIGTTASGSVVIDVDNELSASSENPVQNKVVKTALDGKLTVAEAESGYTRWTVECEVPGVTIEWTKIADDPVAYAWVPYRNGDPFGASSTTDKDATSLSWSLDTASAPITATRTRITPTKTSQLTNDSGFLTQHQSITGKEDVSNKVAAISAQSTDTQYPSAKCVWSATYDKCTLAQVTATEQVSVAWAVMRDGMNVTGRISNDFGDTAPTYVEPGEGSDGYWRTLFVEGDTGDPMVDDDSGLAGSAVYLSWNGTSAVDSVSHTYVATRSAATAPRNVNGLARFADVPVVVAPSTNASDRGKAADAKATGDALAGIAGKENSSNKVTSITEASTDAQYPSAKCVWDGLRYSLVDKSSPVGSIPYMLADMFPIVYTPNGGSAVTIAATDADDLTIDWNEIDNVYDVYYNNAIIFFLDKNGKWGGTGDVDDEADVTFDGDIPTEHTTQVLGFIPIFALDDRAVNAVAVSAATTLTLPALVNAGKARDFLVRLAISGSTVPTITFAAPTGETITYETDGDEFPVPDAEGTWLYSFTETAAHTFAVSLKSVQTVALGGA